MTVYKVVHDMTIYCKEGYTMDAGEIIIELPYGEGNIWYVHPQ